MKAAKRQRVKAKKRKQLQAEGRGKPERPVVVPLVPIDGGKRELKIHGGALSLALQKPVTQDDYEKAAARFKQTFPVAPVPAWVPGHKEVQVALDAAIEPFCGYAGQFAFTGEEFWPGFPALAELTQRSEYRVISETYAKEMTRKWIKLTYKGDKQKKDESQKRIDGINEELERFKVRDLFRKLAEHDGFYGGGQLFIDVGAGNPALPLTITEKTIAKGSLKALVTIEPIWSYPNTYNSTDPLKADYFTPQTWFVMGRLVHRTRLLTLISAEMPDILKPAYSFRGLSLSQRAAPYVQNWLRTRQSVSDLLHSFSIVVLKTMMQSQIADAGGLAAWSSLYSRVDIFNATRDNRGTFLLDKETEEIDVLAVPLGTLDALQAQSQEQMAAVAQIPLVKLLGITPSGLNASSDGEIRVFYDAVHAKQEHLFGAALRQVIDILQLNKFGDIDTDVGFEFEPLWQLDEAGLALVQKTQADIDAINVQEGIVSNEEVRQRLADDPKSQYYGLSLDPEDVPDPPDLGDDPMKPNLSGDPSKQAEPRAQARSGV